MYKFAAIALVAVAGATPALAQEDSSYTGPRVEVIGGFDRVKVGGGSDGGIAFGVGVGYDFQVGGAVLGIEAEAAESTVKDCETDAIVLGDELCVRAKRDFYAGARIGAVTGSTLIYAKAGYTNARLVVDYDDGAGGAGNFTLGDNLDGVRAGVGVEHSFSGHAYIKAEYRYSNYEAGFQRHQLVGGLGFRF